MRVIEARKLRGKRVQWFTHIDKHRGTGIARYGTIRTLLGNNVFMEDGDVVWLPDMIDLREVNQLDSGKIADIQS